MLLSTTTQSASNEAGQCFYFLGKRHDISDDASERRRGLRLRQNRPIKIYEPMSCRFIGGQTEDVSATGLRISVPISSHLRDGSIVNVHVGLSEGGQPLANRREMMQARVVWVDRPLNMRSGTLQAGIEFTASIAAHLDAA